MVDRPIIFSAPMVSALLAGRKTQTRRLLAIRGRRGFSEFGPSDTPGYDWHFRDAHMRWHDLRHAELLAKLPWQVGDRLWVRESIRADEHHEEYIRGIRYLADDEWWPCPATDKWEERHFLLRCYRSTDPDLAAYKPVPSIHMPRWASRLTLTVTDVRVQRVQDISPGDAKAEGLACLSKDDGRVWKWGIPDRDGLPGTDNHGWPWFKWDTDPRRAFHFLWLSIHGAGAWDANLEVVALTFSVEQRNIDAPLRCEPA